MFRSIWGCWIGFSLGFCRVGPRFGLSWGFVTGLLVLCIELC